MLKSNASLQVNKIDPFATNVDEIKTISSNNVEDVIFDQNDLIKFGANLTIIPTKYFKSKKLTNITIPDSVTTICDYAFQHNNLSSVTIPPTVTTICKSTFAHNQLTSVTIPDSVTTIDKFAFCSGSVNSNNYS